MKQMTIEAKVENLDAVLDFVNICLEEKECPMKVQVQLDIAVEEIFVNIAHYAYEDKNGNASVVVEMHENPLAISIAFSDQGKPYNPLEREDPDVTLSAEEREIGGLGIFMVKKSVDNVKYEYKDGQNIFTIYKVFG